MQLALEFTNEPKTLLVVRAFLREALRQLPIEANTADALGELALDVVRDAIEHAYPQGEEGTIKITFGQRRSKLEIFVRDFGMPQEIATLDRRFHESGVFDEKVVDQVHWRSFGPDGKEFQIVKWLKAKDETQSIGMGGRRSSGDDVLVAPQQEYSFRRMTDGQAVQVSQLMFQVYGSTYFNKDVYYPERLAAQNADDNVASFVALAQDGDVVGHYALELNQDGPVAEGGQAAVHPAHRGRGLLGRMQQVALQHARQLKLVGWYADAVSVHTRTQQSHVSHGGHLTAVDLGIAPRSETFHKIAEEQPQRVTCLLYFHWLAEPSPRTIYTPPKHLAIASQIYQNLKCPIRLGKGSIPTGHSRMAVKLDGGAAKAFVRAEKLGIDTGISIRHAKRKLVEHSHIEVVYVELPLQDSATPHVVDELESDGFGFIGIAPHFSASGDLLRLAYLVDPLAREPIKTDEAFADQLVDYTLAEQLRVRNEA
jgi:anti-sigma regulatory factor (Ser/Thr protein kinase)/GNAT superfamily N-acetyltransferase